MQKMIIDHETAFDTGRDEGTRWAQNVASKPELRRMQNENPDEWCGEPLAPRSLWGWFCVRYPSAVDYEDSSEFDDDERFEWFATMLESYSYEFISGFIDGANAA